MKLLKTLGLGVIFWVLIFIVVSLLMFGLGLFEGDPLFYSLDFLFCSLFAIFLSLVYFNGKTKKGFLQGLLIGVIFVIVAIILDSLITIPLFKNGDYSFLIQGNILFNEIIAIILCGFVGWIKRDSVKHIRKKK
jgi:Na+/proline symporter